MHIEELDMPVVGDDEVLVRVRAASGKMYGWDLPAIVQSIGRVTAPFRKPKVPGLDFAGDVEAVGTQQAMATLESSSQALSDLIGSFYGLASGERFLGLWQAHIGLLEDYTVALAAGDEEAAAAARQDLDGLGDDLGSFFDSVGEGFDGGSVSAAFSPYVDTLTTALDAIAIDDPAAVRALGACSDDIRTLAANIPTPSDDALAEQEARVLDFAQCMREQGISDWPDPDFVANPGGGYGPGLSTDFDLGPDEIIAASETCDADGRGFVTPGGAADTEAGG